jgi:hypothetical protein
MARKADVFMEGLVPSVPTEDFEEEPSVTATDTAAAASASISPDIARMIQQAIAARDAEVQALRQELEQLKTKVSSDGFLGEGDDQISVGGYPWMYWKHPETGWITIGPGGPTPNGNRDVGSYTLYLRRGFIPLTSYGVYVEPPKTPRAADQYIPLLRAGGAREFPASQVLAYNWHIRPPLPGIKFPQYEAIKDQVVTFVCEACGHQLFFAPGEKAQAGEAYRSHLMNQHKYPFREAAEAVKVAGLTFAPYRRTRTATKEE